MIEKRDLHGNADKTRTLVAFAVFSGVNQFERQEESKN